MNDLEEFKVLKIIQGVPKSQYGFLNASVVFIFEVRTLFFSYGDSVFAARRRR